MLLFIGEHWLTANINNYFNTSHVTVYLYTFFSFFFFYFFQYISCYCLSSHITISIIYKKISIHLMLLFIGFTQPVIIDKNKFQYISCYCLSAHMRATYVIIKNFNTSHVTVYLFINFVSFYSELISIHLMLLFIVVHFSASYLVCDFNTSHVTVYLFAVLSGF